MSNIQKHSIIGPFIMVCVCIFGCGSGQSDGVDSGIPNDDAGDLADSGDEKDAGTDQDSGADAAVIPPGCEGVIEFPDPVLDQAVRWEIGKSLDEDIHREDIMNLRVLRVENDCESPEVPTIKNLEGIECLTELESLDLSCEEISDISPLSYLVKLESLRLWSNSVTDITPVSGLKNLRYINLGGNSVGDISPLSNIDKLNTLILGPNRFLSDLKPIENLTNLEYLDVHATGINDLRPLKKLINMKLFNAMSNDVVDISSIEDLVHLEYLELSENLIKDISSLENLRYLETLQLRKNSVQDLAPLVNNWGIGEGDRIGVDIDPAYCEEQKLNIEKLEERGVLLGHNCHYTHA